MSLPTQYNGQKQDPVGALSGALARLQANRGLRELREIAKGITKQLPEGFQEVRVLHASQGMAPAHPWQQLVLGGTSRVLWHHSICM